MAGTSSASSTHERAAETPPPLSLAFCPAIPRKGRNYGDTGKDAETERERKEGMGTEKGAIASLESQNPPASLPPANSQGRPGKPKGFAARFATQRLSAVAPAR